MTSPHEPPWPVSTRHQDVYLRVLIYHVTLSEFGRVLWLSVNYAVLLQATGSVFIWVPQKQILTDSHVRCRCGRWSRQHPSGSGRARQGREGAKTTGEQKSPEKVL